MAKAFYPAISLIIVLLAFTQPCTAEATCEASFVAAIDDSGTETRSRQWIREALEIRQISTGVESGGASQWSPLFHGLIDRTTEFRDYLLRSRKPLDTFTEREKARHLKAYIEQFWRKLIDPASRARTQDDSLESELNLRGAHVFQGLHGWARLSRLSSKNRDEVMKKHRLKDISRVHPAIRDLVFHSKLHVRRNSRVPITFGEGVLSSRQLQRLTGIPGYNTIHAFNRDFMKNDDSIYFFVDFQKVAPETQSQYGKHGYWLSENAMPTRAWVSPFVMYNHELGNAYQSSSRFREKLATINSEPGEDFIKVYQPSLFDRAALGKLHHLDFTASDFLTLMQAAFARMLTPSQREVQIERRRNAEAGGTESTDQIIQRLAHSKLQLIESQATGVNPFTSIIQMSIGLPEKMEFKVPVFLPRHHIGQEW